MQILGLNYTSDMSLYVVITYQTGYMPVRCMHAYKMYGYERVSYIIDIFGTEIPNCAPFQ